MHTYLYILFLYYTFMFYHMYLSCASYMNFSVTRLLCKRMTSIIMCSSTHYNLSRKYNHGFCMEITSNFKSIIQTGQILLTNHFTNYESPRIVWNSQSLSPLCSNSSMQQLHFLMKTTGEKQNEDPEPWA